MKYATASASTPMGWPVARHAAQRAAMSSNRKPAAPSIRQWGVVRNSQALSSDAAAERAAAGARAPWRRPIIIAATATPMTNSETRIGIPVCSRSWGPCPIPTSSDAPATPLMKNPNRVRKHNSAPQRSTRLRAPMPWSRSSHPVAAAEEKFPPGRTAPAPIEIHAT